MVVVIRLWFKKMRVLPVPAALATLFTVVLLLNSGVQDSETLRSGLFDQPAKRLEQMRLQQILVVSFAQKKLDVSRQVAERLTHLEPDAPIAWYNLACVQAVSGDANAALISLKTAANHGFRDVRKLKTDSALQSLQERPEFQDILKMAAQPLAVKNPATEFQAGEIKDGIALVTDKNTRWDESRMSLVTSFVPAPGKLEQQIIGTSAADLLVNTWISEGQAAGHVGDLYDNRDRDHSNLNRRKFPQLAFVEYAPEVSRAGADWGMRIGQAFDRPTFGNSSTAQVNSPFWRSNPRMVLYDDLLTKLAYNEFVNNQMYCYPEHNDFDPQHGDVYPANTPFWVISQGSSGSDQPFMEAIALTLAAFRPEVKELLVEKQMLMPVVQMLLRRSQSGVKSDEDYMSGKAHPVVFQSHRLDPLRMVQMAHELTPVGLPALVRLKVTEEDVGVPGRDYFHTGPGERLFDTPGAIARVYRTSAFQRRMVIDAGDTVDFFGRPLTFRWTVLQGNPEQVHIRPLNDVGSQAELLIEWHDRAPVPDLEGMETNRVDIGVFAMNGQSISLPGLISSFTLANEKREYDSDHRIRSIDYGDAKISRRYVDPLIDLPRNWRDDYVYDSKNQMLGWRRTIPGELPMEFSADGRLISKRDEDGNPVAWKNVAYQAKPTDRQTSVLRQIILDTSSPAP